MLANLASELHTSHGHHTVAFLFLHPHAMGPSWPMSNTGGVSAAFRLRQGANSGSQGSRFARPYLQGISCYLSALKRWSIGRSSD